VRGDNERLWWKHSARESETGKIAKEPTPPEVARDYVGGRGFGAYLLYKEVPRGADPLDPITSSSSRAARYPA